MIREMTKMVPLLTAASVACMGCVAEVDGTGEEMPWELTILGGEPRDGKEDGVGIVDGEDIQSASFALTSATGVISWTSGAGLIVRSGPGTSYGSVGWVAEGASVRISCQTTGTSIGGNQIWDYLPDEGGYVTDYYMNSGYSGWISGLPRCGADAGASGTVSWTDGAGLTVRAGPGTGFASVGWVAEGASVTISCQASGTSVGGNTVWNYLPEHGGYVTDYYMNTGSSSWISGVPRCDGDAGGGGSSYDGPDRYILARSSHYGSRSGSPITHIIVHTMQGRYWQSINWFQDPGNWNRTSAHFMIQSSDGEITQMVPESMAAHHIGNWNSFTIGIEHEGWMENPGSWYTDAMYRSSARLVRYLCDKYGIPIDREHILGHGEVPGGVTNDPGPGWDWDRYMALIRAGG